MRLRRTVNAYQRFKAVPWESLGSRMKSGFEILWDGTWRGFCLLLLANPREYRISPVLSHRRKNSDSDLGFKPVGGWVRRFSV